eukprot:353511-Chlamydomonas_euryale.AAC.5
MAVAAAARGLRTGAEAHTGVEVWVCGAGSATQEVNRDALTILRQSWENASMRFGRDWTRFERGGANWEGPGTEAACVAATQGQVLGQSYSSHTPAAPSLLLEVAQRPHILDRGEMRQPNLGEASVGS